MKIVSSFLPPRKLQRSFKEKFGEHEFHFFKRIVDVDENLISEMEVLITYAEDLNPEIIDRASSLKWISAMAAGIDKMPIETIEKRGILVTNARGIHAIPMSEFALGLMLSHVKRLPELRELQDNKTWNKWLPLSELCDKTLLLLGTGAIPEEIARLAGAFRMNVIGVNRSGGEGKHFDKVIPIEQLNLALPEADMVISVLPSTPKTRGLLTYEHFKRMKNNALFINLGRGDLVTMETLQRVLEEELIGQMALDVFPDEPLYTDSPFWDYPNLTITPHISSITENYLPRSFSIFEHNLAVYLGKAEGDYLNKIDLKKGY